MDVILPDQGKEDHKDGISRLRHEIVGIRKALHAEANSHREKVQAVHKNAAEVKVKHEEVRDQSKASLSNIEAQSQTLDAYVVSRGYQLGWMMICLLAAVIVVGGLMWSRMNYYE